MPILPAQFWKVWEARTTADKHYFDVHIAELYGINCAVILQNIWHWEQHHAANGKNFYEGRYWTYNSAAAFSALFPYLSKKQIEIALKKLRDNGILLVNNFNKQKWDRTLWYSVSEKGMELLGANLPQRECTSPESNIEITSDENPFPPEGTRISPTGNTNTRYKPDSKLDIKTDIDNNIVENDNVVEYDMKTITEIVDYLNEKAHKNYRSNSKTTMEHINERLKEGRTLSDFKQVIDNRCATWLGTDMEQYICPETLFGSKFEKYLNAPAPRLRGSDGRLLGKESNGWEAAFDWMSGSKDD